MARRMSDVDTIDLQTVTDAIANELREWWVQESADWDMIVEDAPPSISDADLWDAMPEVDSKAVTRCSFVFEKHSGIALDVRLIRPGGYSSIEDVIDALIPKHLAQCKNHNNQPAQHD